MSTLKELFLNIQSIQSTKKITQVMKLIATSKLYIAKQQLNNAAAYINRIENMFTDCYKRDALLQSSANSLGIIISSNKGLCGSFNNRITNLLIDYLKNNSLDRLVCIGNKSFNILKQEHNNIIVHHYNNPHRITFKWVKNIIQELRDRYTFDSCLIFYTLFCNVTTQKPIYEKIFACKTISDKYIVEQKYEPNALGISNSLREQYLHTSLYKALLHNAASEHMSRMLAMDNATRNAQEMLRELRLRYNRLRQALITKSLIEIISGVEVLS